MGGVRVAVLLCGMALAGACGSGGEQLGGVRVEIGGPVEVSVAHSPVLAKLWVESVRPLTCTEPGSLPPSRDRYLAVSVVVKTSGQYEPHWGWWVSAKDFTTVAPDGEVTGRGLDTSCLPPEASLRDDPYLADSGYQGIVIVDTEDDSGTLLYKPDNLSAGNQGWFWEY